jgi:hypothetical protein
VTTKHITMNAVTFHPSTRRMRKNKIGKLLVAVSGKRNWVQRAHKHEWDFGWNNVTETTRAAVEAIMALTTTFTLIDVDGASYTVQCEESDYNEDTSADQYLPGTDALLYNVTLTVHEQ